VRKWKLLAYHLEDLRVPLVVRVPQVGNPSLKDFIAHDLCSNSRKMTSFSAIYERCAQPSPTVCFQHLTDIIQKNQGLLCSPLPSHREEKVVSIFSIL